MKKSPGAQVTFRGMKIIKQLYKELVFFSQSISLQLE